MVEWTFGARRKTRHRLRFAHPLEQKGRTIGGEIVARNTTHSGNFLQHFISDTPGSCRSLYQRPQTAGEVGWVLVGDEHVTQYCCQLHVATQHRLFGQTEYQQDQREPGLFIVWRARLSLSRRSRGVAKGRQCWPKPRIVDYVSAVVC